MTDTCANCGTGIGKLETPHLWREQVVCAPCYGRLAGAGTIAYSGPSTPLPQHLPLGGRQVQTVEQTGKFWKAQQLLSACVAILGVVLACAGIGSDSRHAGQGVHALGGIGVLMVLGGLVWFFIARVGAWWNHG